MEFANIPSVRLSEHDVLVVNVGVGQMPPVAAKKYLEDVKPQFKEIFGDQPMMMFAVAHETGVTFSVIHRDYSPRKVFHIDIDAPQEEVNAYMEELKKRFGM